MTLGKVYAILFLKEFKIRSVNFSMDESAEDDTETVCCIYLYCLYRGIACTRIRI